MTTPSTRDSVASAFLTTLTTPTAPQPAGGLADVLAETSASDDPVTAAAPPAGSMKSYITDYAAGGGQFTMDPEVMRKAIAHCDRHIEDLTALQQEAYRDLYKESLGIGEAGGFGPAEQLVRKYQHKARGGGFLPAHSSAVGYFQALIGWVTDFRDGHQAALDAYLATDAANAAENDAIGNAL